MSENTRKHRETQEYFYEKNPVVFYETLKNGAMSGTNLTPTSNCLQIVQNLEDNIPQCKQSSYMTGKPESYALPVLNDLTSQNVVISKKLAKEKTKKDRKVLHPQAKEVILNVVNFMKQESNGLFSIPPRKVQCRAAMATGYSERTVRRVVKESKMLNGTGNDQASPVVVFPPKRPPNRTKPKTGLDSLTRCQVRKLIHKIYVNDKIVPTIKKIHQKLVEEIGFKGGSRSAHKIVKEIGFFWKKTNTKSFVLMEKHEIRLKRIEYLRDITRFRHEARPVVYISDAVVQSCSGRAILAGSETGFISHGLVSMSPQLDQWTREALCPHLQPRSVVVLESLSCQQERIPSLESDADTMKKWLTAKGIPHRTEMLRPELHQIIKRSAGRLKKHKSSIEVILTEAGHSVLKTPVDHPDLNAATLIWADVKKCISDYKTTEESTVAAQLGVLFGDIPPSSWSERCAKVRMCEQEYLACEGIVDAQVEKVLTAGRDRDMGPSDDLDDNINFVRNFMGGLLGIEEHKLYS